MNLANENRNYFIYGVVILLFSISIYSTYIVSPELSRYFGYTDENTMFNSQLTFILIGLFVMIVIGKLNAKNWFNRIGGSVLVVSVLLLTVMLFVPSSISVSVNTEKLYIGIGGFSINPMLFFPIGGLWLVSWIHETKENLRLTNYVLLALIVITAGFCIEFNNMGMLLLLEALFLSLLTYINGASKVVIISIFSSLMAGIVFLLMAEHRIVRIKSWLMSSSDFMTSLSIEGALHENILLSLMDNLGIFTFFIVILLFLMLSYLIITSSNQNHKIFTVGIVFLLVLDLIFNILYTFGFLPVYPPSLYLYGYGNSVLLASFVMVGMLTMLQKRIQL